MAISAAGFLVYLFLYFCVNINQSSWVVHIDMEYGHVSLVHVGWKLVWKWINSLICWVVPVYTLDQICKVGHTRSTYFHSLSPFPQSPYPFMFDTASWRGSATLQGSELRLSMSPCHYRDTGGVVQMCTELWSQLWHRARCTVTHLRHSLWWSAWSRQWGSRGSGRRPASEEKNNMLKARRGSPMFSITSAGMW